MQQLKSFFEDAESLEFSRKEIITREGQVEKYLYWVEEGIQRSYYIKNGKEYTIAFTYPPLVTGIPESAMSGKPSRYFLECVTPSRLLRMPYTLLRQGTNTNPELQKKFLEITEIVLIGVLEGQFELMAFTAEEKFTSFLKRSPHLLNQIPHKYRASYLDMDAYTFK
ncbi:MAG: Crp/Fnr family transcriptional regulator [Owenweeksia sp.]